MNRKIYAAGSVLSLAAYCPESDDRSCYECWCDPATQDGYNFSMTKTFEEFSQRPSRCRLEAVIIRNEDKLPLGIITLSPEGSLPDLAIMLYKPYRGMGYGTAAFALAAQYCLEAFDLDCIYAGCYETNNISQKMLKSCGFLPHPDGNSLETHYLTGNPIMQYDFVLRRSHQ